MKRNDHVRGITGGGRDMMEKGEKLVISMTVALTAGLLLFFIPQDYYLRMYQSYIKTGMSLSRLQFMWRTSRSELLRVLAFALLILIFAFFALRAVIYAARLAAALFTSTAGRFSAEDKSTPAKRPEEMAAKTRSASAKRPEGAAKPGSKSVSMTRTSGKAAHGTAAAGEKGIRSWFTERAAAAGIFEGKTGDSAYFPKKTAGKPEQKAQKEQAAVEKDKYQRQLDGFLESNFITRREYDDLMERYNRQKSQKKR